MSYARAVRTGNRTAAALLLWLALFPGLCAAAPDYGALARWLAGLEPAQGVSPSTGPAWTRYARAFDTSWTALERERLGKMRGWAVSELRIPGRNGRPLFYPFSGPDFLSAGLFFPEAPEYVLIGLEPVGALPDFGGMSEASLAAYLDSVERSLGDLFKRSYFRTRRMQSDLDRQGVGGTLPLLLLFLPRLGCEVLSLRGVRLKSDGALEDYELSEGGRAAPAGIRIEFRRKGETRRLFYFSLDLSDGALKSAPQVMAYVRRLGRVNSFLKSAAYLMHGKRFDSIRGAILGQSACVLQDDSGIPYPLYDPGRWELRLYGSYAEPIAEFKDIRQPELERAYAQRTHVPPLPFSLGYHWGQKRGVNLQFALLKPKR